MNVIQVNNDQTRQALPGIQQASIALEKPSSFFAEAKTLLKNSLTKLIDHPCFKELQKKECIELAMLSAQQDGGETSQYIQNFGLDPEEKEDKVALVEIAKLCAQEDGFQTARYIQKFGLNPKGEKDKAALIEIAKLCAEQNGSGTACSIGNFGFDPEEKEDKVALIEIGKLCAQKDGWRTATHIQKFGLNPKGEKDKAALIEIAKLCAEKDGGGTAASIQHFALNPQEKEDKAALVEIGKLCAQQNGWETSQYIQNFGFDPQEKEDKAALIEIAKLCAQQDGFRTARYIQKFGLNPKGEKDKAALIEIAKLCAQQNGWGTACCIQNFGLDPKEKEDKVALIEIAKLCAQKDGLETSQYIQNFGFDPEEKEDKAALIEIAKLCAQQNGRITGKNIKNFCLNPQDKADKTALIEIAKLCAQQNGRGTGENIKNFCLNPQDKADKTALIEIAKLCAQQNGSGTACFIQNFGFNPQEKEDKMTLIEIAKLCAEKDGGGTAAHIQNFIFDPREKEDKTALVEIAKLCAQQNGRGTGENIKNFCLNPQDKGDKTALIEIAKLCAQQNGWKTATHIQNFGFDPQEKEDKVALVEIAKLCAQQNGWKTATHIQNFGLDPEEQEDRAALMEIAKLCAQEDGWGTEFFIPRFGFIPPSNEATKIRCHCFIEMYTRGEVNLEDLKSQVLSEIKRCQVDPISDPQDPKKEGAILLLNIHQLVYFLNTGKKKLGDAEQSILHKLCEYRNRPIASHLCNLFSDTLLNPLVLENYKAVCQDKNYLIRSLLEVSGWTQNPADLQFIANHLQKLRLDFKNAVSGIEQQWLSTVVDLGKSSLSAERRVTLLKQICGTPFKDSKELGKRLAIISALCSLEKEEALSRGFSEKINQELLNLLEVSLQEDQYVNLKGMENFSERYLGTWGSTRKPLAWLIYEKKLKTLSDPTLREEFGHMIQSVLKGTFLEERYSTEKSPHLKIIKDQNPDLFKNWQVAPISKPWSEGIQGDRPELFDFKTFLNRIRDDGHFNQNEFEQLRLFLDGTTIENPDPLVKICVELCQNPIHLKEVKSKLQELQALIKNNQQFAQDIKDLIQPASEQKKESLFELIDTNDWQDLFLSGTEVLGSCQRIDGDPSSNKCLLAYVMDGKNRMIALREKDFGKIKARAIFRLLLDEKKRPILFLDRPYPHNCSSEKKKALVDFAIERAKALGCTLVAQEYESSITFEGTIQSLGSRAPYEYEDAAQGVMKKGEFTISDLKLLYQS